MRRGCYNSAFETAAFSDEKWGKLSVDSSNRDPNYYKVLDKTPPASRIKLMGARKLAQMLALTP